MFDHVTGLSPFPWVMDFDGYLRSPVLRVPNDVLYTVV